MKKWIISLIVILVLCGVRFTDPWFLDMVRMKALDQHQRNQVQESLSNLVTIEINNKTLKILIKFYFPCFSIISTKDR